MTGEHRPTHGIRTLCLNGHSRRVVLEGYSRQQADVLVGLVESSPLARCDTCGAWVNCELFGYDDDDGGGGA